MRNSPRPVALRKVGHKATTINFCNFCPKSFGRRGDLSRHNQLHTGIKPWACDYQTCGKRFAQKSGLKTHLNVHSKAKPYKCDEDGCTSTFGDPSSCARHKKETHRMKNPYKCCHPGCPTSIKRRSAFKSHLKKHGIEVSESDITAMAEKPKKSNATRRKPHAMAQVLTPAVHPQYLQDMAENESNRRLHQSPAAQVYASLPHEDAWYQPPPSSSPLRYQDYHPTVPSMYSLQAGSSSTILSYESPQRTMDAGHHSPPSSTPANYSLWSGSTTTLVDNEGYAQKLYYPEQSYPAHAFLKPLPMSASISGYHHTTPTSSPPPNYYSKIAIPQLDAIAAVGSPEEYDRHHRFSVNPSKIYEHLGSKYGHEDETEYPTINPAPQWTHVQPSQW